MTREESIQEMREFYQTEGWSAHRDGVAISDCPYSPAAPPDKSWGFNLAEEWMKGWHQREGTPESLREPIDDLKWLGSEFDSMSMACEGEWGGPAELYEKDRLRAAQIIQREIEAVLRGNNP